MSCFSSSEMGVSRMRQISSAGSFQGLSEAKSTLSALPLESITAKEVADAAREGDALALEAFDNAADAIAQVFYNVCQMFNCDRIVYGGGLTKVGPLLMDNVLEKFHALLPPSEDFPVAVLRAQLGDETGILGAALLAEH